MRFTALGLFVTWVLAIATSAMATSMDDVVAEVSPLLATRDPANSVVNPASGYSGVALVLLQTANGTVNGSGVLISGVNGDFVLTSAHLVQPMTNASQSEVWFQVPTGWAGVGIAATYIPQGWDALHYANGYDIALIKLASSAPAGATPYALYRGGNEVGQVGTKVGYGLPGTGNGDPTGVPGIKRYGTNRYDALGDVFDGIKSPNGVLHPLTDSELAYDFDNGLAANDAFGYFFGIHDLGEPNEVSPTPGDSGGPTFIDGKIAGITSYALRLANADGTTSDIDGTLNETFGEFAVDTRVSYYADWIDSVVAPEPLTASATLLGLAVLVRYLRRR